MKISKVGGIIAAASKTVAKPLLRVGTIPIVRRIVISYQQAGIFPIVVVVGADWEEVTRQLTGYGVIFLNASEAESSELMVSVRTGLRYLQGKCDKVVFTPVNVPMFTPGTLTQLINTDGQIVAPSYEGKGGHPIVLDSEIIPQLLDYDGADGLRGAMEAKGMRRVWVEVQDKGVITNVHNERELHEQLQTHNSTIMRPVLHMQLEREKAFFSDRLKMLLYLIADTHNMRTACQYSGIAGSTAWEMINNLEQNLGYQIVRRQRGGKDGGSTVLTAEAEDFLRTYQSYEEYLCQVAQIEYEKRFIYTKSDV